MVADYAGYERTFYLSYVPLPGGDLAIKEPWRMALSWLHVAAVEWDDSLLPINYLNDHALPSEDLMNVVQNQIEHGLNSPPTSSIGRLFDAISSLAGIRNTVNYEGQAAIEMEALVDPHERAAYPLTISGDVIEAAPLIQEVVHDLRAGLDRTIIAARFHNGLAQMVVDACKRLRLSHGVSEVMLSGGVWQNMTLLSLSMELLEREGFTVFLHQQVPANDGGLALGQAAIAAWRLEH